MTKAPISHQILLISTQYVAELPAMWVVHCTLEADKINSSGGESLQIRIILLLSIVMLGAIQEDIWVIL